MDYEYILRNVNWTNLPTDPITADGYGIFNIGYRIIQDDFEIGGLDYGSDTNYYGGTSQEEALFRPLHENIDFAVSVVFRTYTGTQNSYSVYFSDVAKVSFSDQGNDAIIIGMVDGSHSELDSQTGAISYPYSPSNNWGEGHHGDTWFNEDFNQGWSNVTEGTEQLSVVIHELAHSMGLADVTENSIDTQQKKTIMSYHPQGWTWNATNNVYEPTVNALYHESTSTDYQDGNPLYAYGLQLLDIQALQSIYGANTSIRSDDGNTYKLGQGLGRDGNLDGVVDADDQGAAFIYTIWDGGGINDSIDASGFTNFGAKIDLREGHFSSIGENGIGRAVWDPANNVEAGNVAIAYGVTIENARGTFKDDLIIGNDAGNIFGGTPGNDTYWGGYQADGGYDTVDYRHLWYAIEAVASAAGSITVTKVDGQTTETDTLYYIDRVVGTDVADGDTFTGTFQDTGGTIKYEGLLGADTYNFNVGVDRGWVEIVDDEDSDLDRLVITNFPDTLDVQLNVHYTSTAIQFNFLDVEGEPPTATSFLQINVSRTAIQNNAGVELVSLNGTDIHLSDIASLSGTGTIGALSTSHLYQNLYGYSSSGYNGGTGGTGAGGGTLPLTDGQGNITGMKVSPLVDGTGVPQAYAETIWHPFVLTDYIGGTGGASMTFETYRQEIAFRSGFNEENVRFTVTSTQGDANLVIHLDDLSLSYTINDFETGRYIEGLLVYDPTLHEWIQNADTATLTGSAGNYSGEYEGDNPPNPIGYVDLTYFLEKVSFANGTTIDMQGTLTFKGTSGNDSSSLSVYGLDSRGDILMGLAGHDVLRGYGGNDILIGGADRDTNYGGSGDDTYIYSLGEAPFSGLSYEIAYENLNEGTDTILFTEGIAPEDLRLWTDSGGDLFIQYSEADIVRVEGTQVSGASRIPEIMERIAFFDETVWDLTNGLYLYNNDTGRILYGSNLHDTIIGGAGIDTLRGYGGNDVLIGGLGRDNFHGNDGDDTFVFGLGESPLVSGSYETITETLNEGTDTILFGEGIAPEDLRLWTDSTGHLYIQFSQDDFVKVLANHTSNATRIGEYLERIVFADETTWDLTNGIYLHNNDTTRAVYGSNYADTILGGSATDTLHGKGGDDVLSGGAGRDIAYGGLGDDTYLFGLGEAPMVSGQYEQVNENRDEGFDKIVFGEGINPEDIRLWTESTGRLIIQYSATDFIRVDGSTTTGSSGGPSRVGEHFEQVVFADETVWDFTNGLYLRNNDTSRSLYGSNYGDIILGGAGIDTINANDGDDYLDGGAGNDTLNGGAGNDFFVFSQGQDTVSDTSGTDTLLITGVTIHQLSFSNVSTYNTRITITGTSDYVTVNNLRNSNTDLHVDNLTFDDGFITMLPNYASWLWGTSGNDLVSGNANDNTLIGGAGADEMYGNGGDDAIHGGAGADEIYGGDGDDLIHGGEGDDVIDGGAGADVIYGGGGADVFVWSNISHGVDTVKDFSLNDDDKLDLANIVSFDPLTEVLADYIRFTEANGNSTLEADAGGTGSNYAALAILEGVTGLNVDDLYSSGNLLVTAA